MIKSSMLSKLLILGGAFMHLPHEMFPSILNTADDVPVKPKHSEPDWNASRVESLRRCEAAEQKRERRAEKLRRLEARNGK